MLLLHWSLALALSLPLAVLVLLEIGRMFRDRAAAALARVDAMADREAAHIARAITAMPPGPATAALEQTMLDAAVLLIDAELAAAVRISGSQPRILGLLTAHLDSLLVRAPGPTPIPPGVVAALGPAARAALGTPVLTPA